VSLFEHSISLCIEFYFIRKYTIDVQHSFVRYSFMFEGVVSEGGPPSLTTLVYIKCLYDLCPIY